MCENLWVAVSCVRTCSEVFTDDLVWFRDGAVGWVVRCFGVSGIDDLVLEFDIMARVDANDPKVVLADVLNRQFKEADGVLDVCAWAFKRPGVIRVMQPFANRRMSF